MKDHVDLVLSQWAHERPDLDVSSMAVLARIFRVQYRRAAAHRAACFAPPACTRDSSTCWPRCIAQASPHALSPQQLTAALLLSSGAMTHRLDQLEQGGLIARSPNPDDRRGVIVSLTPAGLRTIRQILADYLEAIDALLTPLSATERRQLAGLLKRLLAEHDRTTPGGIPQ